MAWVKIPYDERLRPGDLIWNEHEIPIDRKPEPDPNEGWGIEHVRWLRWYPAPSPHGTARKLCEGCDLVHAWREEHRQVQAPKVKWVDMTDSPGYVLRPGDVISRKGVGLEDYRFLTQSGIIVVVGLAGLEVGRVCMIYPGLRMWTIEGGLSPREVLGAQIEEEEDVDDGRAIPAPRPPPARPKRAYYPHPEFSKPLPLP